MTVGLLKGIIEKQHKGQPQQQDQLLVFRGKLLESRSTLSALFTASKLPNLNNESMSLHLTLRGGAATADRIGLHSKTDESKSDNQTSLTPKRTQPTTTANEAKHSPHIPSA